MLDQLLKELPAHRPIILDNQTCVYCGAPLDDVGKTKEHVIGRKFVPTGKLSGQWNLIVWACMACNGRKSDLEDDLSAITMQPDMTGRFAHDDQVLVSEARRKAGRSISRRTKKTVKNSVENMIIKVPFAPGIEFTFNMSPPPQTDSERVFELARLQLMAFFYFITFTPSNQTGGFWIGQFFPIMEAMRQDWGNPVHRAFMDAVFDWEPRILAIGADGYFKAVIRRHPSAACWSWALEWNRKCRVIGFFGEHDPAAALVKNLPALPMQTVQQPDGFVRFRTETPLADNDDKLFEVGQK